MEIPMADYLGFSRGEASVGARRVERSGAGH
jgi:hypothetical protein